MGVFYGIVVAALIAAPFLLRRGEPPNLRNSFLRLALLTVALASFTALVVAQAAQQRDHRVLVWMLVGSVVAVYAGPVAQRWAEAWGDVRRTASDPLLRVSASAAVLALAIGITAWQPGSRLALTTANAVALLVLLSLHRRVLVLQRDYIASLPADGEERLAASFEWATLGASFGLGVATLGIVVALGALGPFGTAAGGAEVAVAVVGFAVSMLGLAIAVRGTREQRRLGDKFPGAASGSR